MQPLGESKGLVLFSRDYREKDKLVKIFTESYGKVMFLVKNVHRKNNPLTSSLFPFTEAVYSGNVQNSGLSFLNTVKETHPFRQIQTDIFISAYATYILNLVDVAIEDHQYDPALYGFTKEALAMLDSGKDPEIITNIFEIQLLRRFGIEPEWKHCVICDRTSGVSFDYSSKYGGIICQEHAVLDPHRYHANPRAVHFVRMFSSITYQQINSIELSTDVKKEIRKLVDHLYEEYVGIRLKSKKFIEEMSSWEDMLKDKPKE